MRACVLVYQRIDGLSSSRVRARVSLFVPGCRVGCGLTGFVVCNWVVQCASALKMRGFLAK